MESAACANAPSGLARRLRSAAARVAGPKSIYPYRQHWSIRVRMKWNRIMSESNKIRVLCIDYHPTVLDGLSAIINLQPEMTVTGTARNGSDGLERFRLLRRDVTLADL